MQSLSSTLERGIAHYVTLVHASPPLRDELARSRSAFAGDREAEVDAGSRRHLEWFLFERPSESLEGVPVEVLQAAWHEACEGAERDLFEALLGSFSSAFVVETVEDAGLLVRDVFGLGQHVILEPDAAAGLVEGDLLVGRVFPVETAPGERGMLLSPAVQCLRDATLVEALERDVERLRSTRRGVLRIQQRELEQMFFLVGGPSGEAPEGGDPRPAARAGLVEAGLPEGRAQEVVDQVLAATGDPVTEILNDLAFHTQVDLEIARRALVELWAERNAVEPGADSGRASDGPAAAEAPARRNGQDATPVALEGVPETASDSRAGSEGPATRRGPLQFFGAARSSPPAAAEAEERPADALAPGAVRAALESFDAGRAKGRDLEELFSQLESDLDLADPGSGEDDEGAPDFPGVVGAMVTEFRWESERVDPSAAQGFDWSGLDAFAETMGGLGLFEDLTSDAVIGFAARTALDEGHVRSAEDVQRLLDTLLAFAVWCDRDHGLTLAGDVRSAREALATSLPRLLEVREQLGLGTETPRPDVGALYRVAFVGGARLALEVVPGGGGDDFEDHLEVRVDEPVARALAADDLVWMSGPVDATVLGVYPSQAREALLIGRAGTGETA